MTACNRYTVYSKGLISDTFSTQKVTIHLAAIIYIILYKNFYNSYI